MARKCTASINLSAIKENYLYAKSLAPNSKAIAIIKADAYGHGAIEVAKEFMRVNKVHAHRNFGRHADNMCALVCMIYKE